MSLEQAILDRLEKRNAQIEMLQQTIQAMSHAADAEREHTRQQLGPLIEENKKLAAQIESDENVSQSNREHAQYQIASLTAEVAKLRAEVPLESTREGLKNAVAKLQEVTTDRDRVLNELAAIVAECAELQGKYESLLAAQNTVKADVAMVYQIADKLGRNQAESIPEFMERQALRVAALESQAGKIGYVAKGEHEEAVTAARENGIHKGESLSGFIWRQCEGLRKSQAENAPLNKLFVVLCKQRGNLNEEIIYRAVDEASNAIRQLTA